MIKRKYGLYGLEAVAIVLFLLVLFPFFMVLINAAKSPFEITQNPLLLSTLCLVHHSDWKLPDRRGDLYDRCISLLLEMGFAVMLGILLVAFLMASVLVPSVATVLGRRIWWPGHQYDSSGEERDSESVEGPFVPELPAEEPLV